MVKQQHIYAIIVFLFFVIGGYFLYQQKNVKEVKDEWVISDELTSQYNPIIVPLIEGDKIECLLPICTIVVGLNEAFPNVVRVYECGGSDITPERLFEDFTKSELINSEGIVLHAGWEFDPVITSRYISEETEEVTGVSYYVYKDATEDGIRVYSKADGDKYCTLYEEGMYTNGEIYLCGDLYP